LLVGGLLALQAPAGGLEKDVVGEGRDTVIASTWIWARSNRRTISATEPAPSWTLERQRFGWRTTRWSPGSSARADSVTPGSAPSSDRETTSWPIPP